MAHDGPQRHKKKYFLLKKNTFINLVQPSKLLCSSISLLWFGKEGVCQWNRQFPL